MSVIVVDYNAGNLTSVMNALSRIGVDAKSSPTNKVYKRLIQLCDTLNIPGYKKRIIPQIYSRPDYKRYKKIYNFPYGILTLYRRTPMPAKRLRVFAK